MQNSDHRTGPSYRQHGLAAVFAVLILALPFISGCGLVFGRLTAEIRDTNEVMPGDYFEIDESFPFLFARGALEYRGSYIPLNPEQIEVLAQAVSADYTWVLPEGISVEQTSIELVESYETWTKGDTKYSAMAQNLKVRARFYVSKDARRGGHPLIIRVPALAQVANALDAYLYFPQWTVSDTKEKLVAADQIQVHTIRVHASKTGRTALRVLLWGGAAGILLWWIGDQFGIWKQS